MSRQLTKQLLLSSNYWVLNKTVVRIFGLETAFLLSNFAEAETMMADKDGWFYQTSDTIEKITTLSRHKQDQCIKQLQDLDVLKKDVRGMPAKRYFKINYECLTNLIVKNSQTGLSKISKQDCKKSATNKESSYKESNHKEHIKEVDAHFEKMWKLYPNKKGKGRIANSESKKKEIYKLGDEFERCIKRYINEVEKERLNGFKELQYQNGSTFFNSGYVDYLDENYKELINGEEDYGCDAGDGYEGLGLTAEDLR